MLVVYESKEGGGRGKRQKTSSGGNQIAIMDHCVFWMLLVYYDFRYVFTGQLD